jgi:enamine deaminase RidA (YjgF/YER057c/UK114 family)
MNVPFLALPTSTWFGISSLALDELLIEIEATAVIDATDAE